MHGLPVFKNTVCCILLACDAIRLGSSFVIIESVGNDIILARVSHVFEIKNKILTVFYIVAETNVIILDNAGSVDLVP